MMSSFFIPVSNSRPCDFPTGSYMKSLKKFPVRSKGFAENFSPDSGKREIPVPFSARYFPLPNGGFPPFPKCLPRHQLILPRFPASGVLNSYRLPYRIPQTFRSLPCRFHSISFTETRIVEVEHAVIFEDASRSDVPVLIIRGTILQNRIRFWGMNL